MYRSARLENPTDRLRFLLFHPNTLVGIWKSPRTFQSRSPLASVFLDLFPPIINSRSDNHGRRQNICVIRPVSQTSFLRTGKPARVAYQKIYHDKKHTRFHAMGRHLATQSMQPMITTPRGSPPWLVQACNPRLAPSPPPPPGLPGWSARSPSNPPDCSN